MDYGKLFPPEVLAMGVVILAATFGTVFAITQAGLPSKWSYLAAIGVGAVWGLLLGGTQYGIHPMLFTTTVFGALTGLGTQTASRRPAEKIVTEGVTKLGEPQSSAALVVTTPDPTPPGSTTIVTTPEQPKG